jgi:nucleotide-binding universal stress UspA family protein
MPYKCVLVGYDGSEESKKAVARAVEIVKVTGARLRIATVIPPPTVFLGELLIPEQVDVSTLENQARSALDSLAREIREVAGLDNVETVVLVGDPATELVAHAESEGCDLLVVGRRGRGGLQRLLLGSVSSKVVSLSHKVDVLVVRSERGEEG